MTHPAVSICIPTYNGAEYLHACLDSVAAQTFRDFEVLIVDEGSSDGTVEIAREFARADSRYRITINEKRLGLVSNWNRCVELARGQWVKFLFQDDLIEPQCLRRLVDACEASGRLFGFCERHIIYDDHVKEDVRSFFEKHTGMIRDVFQGRTVLDERTFSETCVDNSAFNWIGEPTVALLHRSVFERVGLFNANLIQICDVEFWNRVGSNFGIVYVPELLAAFRVHGTSTTSRNAARRAYRMGVLDPLVADYLVLRHEHYRNYRRALYAKTGRVMSWRFFAHRAQKAQLMVQPAASHLAQERLEMKHEWDAVVEAYPEIPRFARWGRLLAGLSGAARKTILRRSSSLAGRS